VVGCPPVGQWPFLVNVEVLEHLQDPVQFLESLRTMLAPGGYGFITAAINAAERDHIYLYESPEEVQQHLEQAGFLVLEQQVDKAYEARDRLPAPGNVAFLVTNA
jgi:2-polyprenyl-3-methyl-5-hydroxy-6-metoxy-1,4-benzoquinol methylase